MQELLLYVLYVGEAAPHYACIKISNKFALSFVAGKYEKLNFPQVIFH